MASPSTQTMPKIIEEDETQYDYQGKNLDTYSIFSIFIVLYHVFYEEGRSQLPTSDDYSTDIVYRHIYRETVKKGEAISYLPNNEVDYKKYMDTSIDYSICCVHAGLLKDENSLLDIVNENGKSFYKDSPRWHKMPTDDTISMSDYITLRQFLKVLDLINTFVSLIPGLTKLMKN